MNNISSYSYSNITFPGPRIWDGETISNLRNLHDVQKKSIIEIAEEMQMTVGEAKKACNKFCLQRLKPPRNRNLWTEVERRLFHTLLIDQKLSFKQMVPHFTNRNVDSLREFARRNGYIEKKAWKVFTPENWNQPKPPPIFTHVRPQPLDDLEKFLLDKSTSPPSMVQDENRKAGINALMQELQLATFSNTPENTASSQTPNTAYDDFPGENPEDAWYDPSAASTIDMIPIFWSMANANTSSKGEF